MSCVSYATGMLVARRGGETIHVGEQTIQARPGSFVFGPRDVPHAYTVESGPAKLLFLLSPPGFEGFIEAIKQIDHFFVSVVQLPTDGRRT